MYPTLYIQYRVISQVVDLEKLFYACLESQYTYCHVCVLLFAFVFSSLTV